MNLEHLLEQYGYLAVFFGTFIEGESMLLLGSYAAHGGYLRLPLVVATALLAAVSSDQLYFYFGRRYGSQLLARRPSLQPKVDKALGLVQRHGALTVFAMRFLWGFRIALPVAIGTSRMPATRYLLLDIAGGALWAAVVASIGYGSVHLVSTVIEDLHRHELAVAVTLLVLASAVVLYRWWPRPKSLTARGTPRTR